MITRWFIKWDGVEYLLYQGQAETEQEMQRKIADTPVDTCNWAFHAGSFNRGYRTEAYACMNRLNARAIDIELARDNEDYMMFPEDKNPKM